MSISNILLNKGKPLVYRYSDCFYGIQIRVSIFSIIKYRISKMGCESSNFVEVIPVEAQQIDQNHPQPAKEQAACNTNQNATLIEGTHSKTNRKGTNSPQKENNIPLKLSIKLVKPADATNKEQGEVTKRKSRSEYRIPEDVLNETANIQKPTEEKKKSLIIPEKGKTLSAKEVKQKSEVKPAKEEAVGPSTHSIPDQKIPSKRQISHKVETKEDLLTPIVVHKTSAPQAEGFAEEPPIESLSEELKSQRSGRSAKSFKFQVYVESSAEILSKTQKFNKKLSIFVEKEEVSRYLQMIEFGEKEEILGKIYEQLEKKEEWNEVLVASSKSCEPLVVVVTESGVTVNHQS